jgi:hypothetical protein
MFSDRKSTRSSVVLGAFKGHRNSKPNSGTHGMHRNVDTASKDPRQASLCISRS